MPDDTRQINPATLPPCHPATPTPYERTHHPNQPLLHHDNPAKMEKYWRKAQFAAGILKS